MFPLTIWSTVVDRTESLAFSLPKNNRSHIALSYRKISDSWHKITFFRPNILFTTACKFFFFSFQIFTLMVGQGLLNAGMDHNKSSLYSRDNCARLLLILVLLNGALLSFLTTRKGWSLLQIYPKPIMKSDHSFSLRKRDTRMRVNQTYKGPITTPSGDGHHNIETQGIDLEFNRSKPQGQVSGGHASTSLPAEELFSRNYHIKLRDWLNEYPNDDGILYQLVEKHHSCSLQSVVYRKGVIVMMHAFLHQLTQNEVFSPWYQHKNPWTRACTFYIIGTRGSHDRFA